MEVADSGRIDGALSISTGVITKIARLAALETEGVQAVFAGTGGVQGLFRRIELQKPVLVQFTDGIAEITVHIIVRYGSKIPSLCAKIQENVKGSVQNMTGITVSKVNIVVAGIAQEAADRPA